MTAEQEIRAMLRRFRDGYAVRDLASLDDFMREFFVDCDDLLVVGTSSEEWCEGLEAATRLVEQDWHFWRDFSLDTDDAVITAKEYVGWIAAWGTVVRMIDAGSSYEKERAELERILESDGSARDVCLKALGNLAERVSELERGNCLVWPIRITATVALHEGKWRFYQMHFSFPNKGISKEPGK